MASETNPTVLLGLRARLLQKSPRRRKLARRIVQAWGPDAAGGDACLLVADESLAAAVRDARGAKMAWHAAAVHAENAGLLAAAGFGEAPAMEGNRVPLETGAVDVLAVSDVLEYAENPTALMAEFHRVLRPKGRLVLHVRRRRLSLVPLLRRLAGLDDPLRRAVHENGFTPAELFDALKDGFDVQEETSFGRFFTELAEIPAELFAGLVPGTCEPAAMDARRLRRALAVYAVFSPFFLLAGLLDAVCFFLPSHHLVLRARRRMLWAPRVTPRLRDGRSIAEAALGSKIGTAAGQD